MFRYTPTTIQPNQPLQQYQQPQQQQSPMSGLAGLLDKAVDVGLIGGDSGGGFEVTGINPSNFSLMGGGAESAGINPSNFSLMGGGAESAAAGGMDPVASMKAAEADSGFKNMLSSVGPFGIITGLLNGDQKMTGMWDSIKELF